MMRTSIAAFIVWSVPLVAAAQSGGGTPTPISQGPMTVERIHSGFLFAPDIKITEVDQKTSPLVGGFAGWSIDDTFFYGAGGYWLASRSRDRQMAYGGIVVQWRAHARERLSYGVKGLFGGGEAAVGDTITVRIPQVVVNGKVTVPETTRLDRVRYEEHFLVAEPEALLLVRLTRSVRLTGGVGYRFTDNRGEFHHSGHRLSGATGSVALQIGGGT